MIVADGVETAGRPVSNSNLKQVVDTVRAFLLGHAICVSRIFPSRERDNREAIALNAWLIEAEPGPLARSSRFDRHIGIPAGVR
jgi:hypothetical protein